MRIFGGTGGGIGSAAGALGIVFLVVAIASVGCGGPSTKSTAKPKPKKQPTKKAVNSGATAATPPANGANSASGAAPHPTDALGWDKSSSGGERVSPRDAAGEAGDSASEEPGFGDSADPSTDAPESEAAAPGSDSDAATPDTDTAKAPSDPATDLAAEEKNLVSAKAALTDKSEEKDKEQFFSDALTLIDDAIAADDYAVAGRTAALALEVAPTISDTEFAGEAIKSKRKIAQFEAAYRRATTAREKLAASADDGPANTGLGNYLCYLQGKWDEGLPHLAKGEDAAAKKAATLDLAAPTTAEAQQAVADAWWTVAGRQEGIAKAQVMLRARHWYDQIRETADVDLQQKLRARMDMIDKYAATTGVNVELGLDAALPESTGKLTPTQRGRVQQLLADFRHAAGNPGRLETTANKLMSIGGPAVSQLLLEVNKQLQPQLQRYGQAFQEQARAVQASRGGANTAEVERLRAQVLALKEMPNLTKDMIVQQGDPAMAQLTDMLVVQPKMVLERSAKLRDERAKLLAIGRQWERAQQYLIAAMLEEEAKAKLKRSSRGSRGANQAATEERADEGDGKTKDDSESALPPPPNFAKYLEGEEDIAAKLVMPMDNDARETLAANNKLIGQIETEEARAILACNLMRQLLGLNVLKIDLKLCDAARDHSKDMATLNFFAHESPVPGKTTPWDRAKNFGTTASGENIAAGYADGNAANLGWFHSPGHHKNMLGGHQRIGLGVHGSHYTELFGG
jgi:uncharacterized protein YkwD